MKQKLNKYFDKANLTKFGSIAAFKGTKGDIVLKPQSLDYEINESEPVLVETDGYLVPFFIDNDSVFYQKNGEISLKFDNINSNTEAANLMGKDVYVATEDLISYETEDDDEEIFKYRNWEVYDQNDNLLGKIIDIDDIPGNPLIIIHNSFNEEILVPLNATEVLSENDTINTIKITIPDGLIDALKNN